MHTNQVESPGLVCLGVKKCVLREVVPFLRSYHILGPFLLIVNTYRLYTCMHSQSLHYTSKYLYIIKLTMISRSDMSTSCKLNENAIDNPPALSVHSMSEDVSSTHFNSSNHDQPTFQSSNKKQQPSKSSSQKQPLSKSSCQKQPPSKSSS